MPTLTREPRKGGVGTTKVDKGIGAGEKVGDDGGGVQISFGRDERSEGRSPNESWV